MCQCVGNLNVDVYVDMRVCVYHLENRLSFFQDPSLTLIPPYVLDFSEFNSTYVYVTKWVWVCVCWQSWRTYNIYIISVVYRATAHFCVVVLLNGGHDGRAMCGEGELVDTNVAPLPPCHRSTLTVLPPRPIKTFLKRAPHDPWCSTSRLNVHSPNWCGECTYWRMSTLQTMCDSPHQKMTIFS